MLEQVARLHVFINVLIIEDQYADVSHKCHAAFIGALNKVKHLKLVSSPNYAHLSTFVHALHWPNLRHLELCGMQCTEGYFQNFLSKVDHPLEQLDLMDIDIFYTASLTGKWYDIFVMLTAKHRLSLMRFAWGPQFVMKWGQRLMKYGLRLVP